MTHVKTKMSVKKWREKQHTVLGTILGSIWNLIMIIPQSLGWLLTNLIDTLEWLAGLALMGIGFGYAVDSYSHLLGKGDFLTHFYWIGIEDIFGVALTLGLTFIVQCIQWRGAQERSLKKNLGDVDNIKADNTLIFFGLAAYGVEFAVALYSVFAVNNSIHFLVKIPLAIIMVVGVEAGYKLFNHK